MKNIGRLMVLGLMAGTVLVQGACSPIGVAAGAGAGVGIAAAQEGGVSGAATDLRIRTQINDLWFRTNTDIFRKLNLQVDQGRVLITGVVQNPEHRVDAVRLAWQPKGVKQVINEIRVADSEGVPGYVRDTWISAQLRTKLTFNRDVQSINYSIDTVQGIVYLMGVARSQEELNQVIETARTIDNVRQVISYVKMLGEPILTSTSVNNDPQTIGATATQNKVTAAPVDDVLAAPISPSPEPVTSTPLSP